jgi:glycerol-3-phosphate O-acyltransferase / dihydroxyacetone phosphate acyltransferase
MWFYSIFCPASEIGLRPFYKKVFISNFDAIPLDQPVILAANHPTGFVDPLVLSAYIKKDLWHMTRGDLFRTPLVNYLLQSANMFPVYRFKEGFEDARRNQVVFDYCTEKLANNQILAIYVEGNSAHEKRIRPLQKGAARIAFEAFGKNKQQNLQIFPVTCNYTFATEPRSEVMFAAGSPIFIKDYFDLFVENPAQAIFQINQEIDRQLRNSFVEIKNKSDEPLSEHLFELYRNPISRPLSPHFSTDIRRLQDEKAISDRINCLQETEKSALFEKTTAYFLHLKNQKITDFGLTQSRWSSWVWLIFGLIGFFPATIGKILTIWPAYFAKWVMQKTARKQEFQSSIFIGVCIVTYLLVWFPAFIFIAISTKKAIFIAISLILPLWGYLSILFFEICGYHFEARKAQNLSKNDREKLWLEREMLTKTAFSTIDFRLK